MEEGTAGQQELHQNGQLLYGQEILQERETQILLGCIPEEIFYLIF